MCVLCQAWIIRRLLGVLWFHKFTKTNELLLPMLLALHSSFVAAFQSKTIYKSVWRRQFTGWSLAKETNLDISKKGYEWMYCVRVYIICWTLNSPHVTSMHPPPPPKKNKVKKCDRVGARLSLLNDWWVLDNYVICFKQDDLSVFGPLGKRDPILC